MREHMASEKLISIILQIEKSPNVEEAWDELLRLMTKYENIEDILAENIAQHASDNITLLNKVAVFFYQNQVYDYIIPLLQEALNLDPSSDISLYNMGKVLSLFGEYRLALQYLKRIENKDYNINILIEEISSKMTPFLSICIATYNRSERLKKCLDSIYNQIGNDQRFQVVVSDNASSDNTKGIIQEYRKRFDNLCYFRNEKNIGPEKNFINAIQKSSGQYIFMHGDDDYFVEGSLSIIINKIQENPTCGIVFLRVTDKSNTSYVINGMEEFLLQTSIYSTFGSSLIMKREDLFLIDNLEKKLGSYLFHLYWIYSILKNNPRCLIINQDIYYCEKDNAPGGYIYSFAEVMIKNYFDILSEFVGEGLNKNLIKREKAKLVNRSLWYLEYGLQRRDRKFVSNFEEIFFDYYHDEEYFKEAWDRLLQIKSSNPI